MVFLIDQSTSMNVKDANGKTRAEKVVEAVQSAVIDCVDGCISGTNVKNRFFLTIIGYGGEPTPSVTTIKEDWAKDLIPDLQAIRTNGGTFIPAEALGWTPMAEAFDLAKECLENWLEACQEKVEDGSYLGIPAPIVGYTSNVWTFWLSASFSLHIALFRERNLIFQLPKTVLFKHFYLFVLAS